jgi:hypothetical protein
MTQDEALVLFEWIARFNASKQSGFRDQAEQRVLFDMEAVLEKNLAQVFAEDYVALVEKARAAVRDQEQPDMGGTDH